jgi:hypothetical protein
VAVKATINFRKSMAQLTGAGCNTPIGIFVISFASHEYLRTKRGNVPDWQAARLSAKYERRFQCMESPWLF